MVEITNFYTTPNSMEPLFPDGDIRKLEDLSFELICKASRLQGTMNPITKNAVSNFLRPMNRYYSNLIEGQDTHPIDIELKHYKTITLLIKKRDLQLEALAHIRLHEEIGNEIKHKNLSIYPSSTDYIKSINKRFYTHLPDDFKEVLSKDGKLKSVIPGELRVDEVKVGKHIVFM